MFLREYLVARCLRSFCNEKELKVCYVSVEREIRSENVTAVVKLCLIKEVMYILTVQLSECLEQKICEGSNTMLAICTLEADGLLKEGKTSL